MARSPLFSSLRRALREIGRAAPPASAGSAPWTRRQFLAGAAAGLGAAACGAAQQRPRTNDARVAIVGAGAAGLAAALRLERAGIAPMIFEASRRIGGRVMTAQALHGAGQWTELGGEFIDTGHTEVHAYARLLGLELLDFEGATDGLEHEAYFFGGQFHRHDELVAGLTALAPRIQEDLDRLGDAVDHRHEGGATALDRRPLSAYFRDLGAGGWLADLLDVAYLSEFGLDPEDQSALNFLFLYSTETGLLYGESDERFKIRGGNQQLVDGLAGRVRAPIEREHKLVAVRERGSGVRLVLERPGATSREVDADAVILTLPFSTLREVELAVPLAPVKRRCIQELGYGTSAKLLVGCARRPWRTAAVLSDEPFQMVWDASRLQPGETGTLTAFLGGAAGVALGTGTAEEHARALVPALDRVMPGVADAAAALGRADRMHWPTQPFTKGSYACYRPGQWTTIHGAEPEPDGVLYFAGEHCSDEHQGYIEGALRTGHAAADAVVARVTGRASSPSRA